MAPRNRSKKHVPLDQLNTPPKGSKPAKPSKKKLLQEAANRPVTDEEAEALMDAFFKGHPYAAAILGQCMVEYELDKLLRRKLKKVDDGMWKKMTESDGPLGTFSRKTTAAAALGLITEITASKLKTIRVVRNQFAHSQRLLRFSDPLILAELHATRFMKSESYMANLLAFAYDGNDAAALTVYRKICDLAGSAIVKRYSRSLATSNQHLDRKIKRLEEEVSRNPFTFAGSSGLLRGIGALPLEIGPDDPMSPGPLEALYESLRSSGGIRGDEKD